MSAPRVSELTIQCANAITHLNPSCVIDRYHANFGVRLDQVAPIPLLTGTGVFRRRRTSEARGIRFRASASVCLWSLFLLCERGCTA